MYVQKSTACQWGTFLGGCGVNCLLVNLDPHCAEFSLPTANTYNSDCNKQFALMAAKLVGLKMTLSSSPGFIIPRSQDTSTLY